MGSIDPLDNSALRHATKLPFFNTTTHTAGLRAYHKVDYSVLAGDQTAEALLEGFARFVSAVAGSAEVTFLAEQGSEQFTVSAVASRSNAFELAKTVADPDTTCSDFGISLDEPRNVARSSRLIALWQPLVVLVSQDQDARALDITLHLRGDYGPLIAAQHLLDLVVDCIGCNSNSSQPKTPNAKSSHLAAAFQGADGLHSHGQPKPTHLHQILEETARRYPHNIALDAVVGRKASSYLRRELTYQEFNDKVTSFSNEIEILLHRLGWPVFRGGQKIVPVLLPASIELSIFMNAMSRIGHSFCSLPMDAPQDRLRDLLDDLNAPGILGVGPNPWEGSDFGKSIVWIDFYNLQDSLTNSPSAPTSATAILDGPLPSRRTPLVDDLAYMIYTSGSSGKPKGVMVLHRIAIAFIHAFDAACNDGRPETAGSLPTGPRLRWMALCLPTFDVTLLDNFVPLFKGGTVCVADRNLLLTDPEAVLSELRATATFTVSSLAMLLRPERVPTLTMLCCGGEMVGQRVVDNFAPPFIRDASSPVSAPTTQRHLVNFYGPSETTAGVAIHFCNSASRPSIVGPPLPGTHFVVLQIDDSDAKSKDPQNLKPAPFGVAGELAIGGPQLSPGYLNRPVETANAFIQHNELGVLYRTGDKVRVVWTEQGEPMIDFLGRASAGQVKLNGRRVELAEIENVVASVEAVAQVVIILVDKSAIVACVEPWEAGVDERAVEADCRAVAERSLPSWMQPMHYFVVDKFPRTANDKVDRKTLEAMFLRQRSSGDAGTRAKERAAARPGGDATSKAASREPLAIHADTSASTALDPATIVYEGLVDALGQDLRQQSKTTVLANAGFDSLRALVFLQKLRDIGVNHLAIHTVLTAETVQDLIDLVEDKQSEEEPPHKNASPVQISAPKDTNGTAPTTTPSQPIVDNDEAWLDTNRIDVRTIPKDDEESIYDLSIEGKLRHFDFHCRPTCLEALHLATHQIEQVLPATNVQVRFIAVATDDELLDPERYAGRPHVEHFAYQVPLDMDPARFQRAVDTVLARHDCFRTVFVASEHPLAPFAQCILSPSATKISKIEITCDDADADSDSDRSTSLWHQTIHGAQRAAEASMTLDKPGIALSYVWSPTRARCVATMSFFHGIYDGTQLTYLRDEIVREYAAAAASPTRPTRSNAPATDLLPMRTAAELNLRYDWVETMMYWAGRFAGVPGCRLRSRRPQPIAELPLPAIRQGAEETHMRLVATNATMSLGALSQAAVNMSTTMLTVVEAAWASVLAQTFSDEERAGVKPLDIQFGTVMSGRRQREALMCMAPLMAAMPTRLLLQQQGSEPRLTNRQVCSQLVAQHAEAAKHLQIPCPTLTHARTGIKRIDTILLVQTLQPEGGAAQDLLELPGYNYEENLLAPFKEIDTGYPLVMELWPGKQSWEERMLLRCLYNARRPGYEFLKREWVVGVLGALDEAIQRIVAEPDAPFYMG